MKNNTIELEIRRRTEAFAAELSDLIRRSVLDSIHGTFGAAGPSAPGAAASASRSNERARRGRGPSGAFTVAISDFVAKNPGSRVDQIARGLGLATPRLKKVVAAMLASGELKKTGQRRGTQYHPGKSPVVTDGASGAPKKTNGRRGKRKGRKSTTKRAARG